MSNKLAAYVEPSANAVALHVYERTSQELRHFIADNMSVADNRALPLALNDCRQIIDALDGLLVPCGPKRATDHVRVLLGCYPRIEPHDAKTYTQALVSVMAEAPEDIARQAIDRITRECKFVPTRAELHDKISNLTAERRIQKRAAQKLIDMHLRRKEQAERDREIAEDKAERLKTAEGA